MIYFSVITWGDVDSVNCDQNIDFVPLVPKSIDPHWNVPFEVTKFPACLTKFKIGSDIAYMVAILYNYCLY